MPKPTGTTKDIFDNLSELASRYAKHVDRSETTVARWASGSGDTLARLANNKPITTARVDRIYQWFSDNWPSGLEWPSGIRRPLPKSLKKTQRRTA